MKKYEPTTRKQRKAKEEAERTWIVRFDYKKDEQGNILRRMYPKADTKINVRGRQYKVQNNGSLIREI